jgi:hypothetical protein
MDISTRVILFPIPQLNAAVNGTDPKLIKPFDITVTQVKKTVCYISDWKLLIQSSRAYTWSTQAGKLIYRKQVIK